MLLLASGLVAAIVFGRSPEHQRSAASTKLHTHEPTSPSVAKHSTPSSSSSTTTTTLARPSSSTTTTVRHPPPAPYSAAGSYVVASSTLEVTDSAGVPGGPRLLPTTIWYPTRATVAARGRPYPLIVFSQGYDMAVSAYSSLLSGWASAGFVVAAPTYPHTSPGQSDGLDENDIVNHPADLRAVIASVLGDSVTPGSPLAGLVNKSEIGLAGQSDGADVSLAVADNTCCRDALVKAVAVLSGAELASFGGQYYGDDPGVSLLAVQGSADTVNAPVCSAELYDAAPAPRYYLDLVGAGHLSPYIGGSPYERIAAQVTTDFFDATLAKQPAAAGAMIRAAAVPGAVLRMGAASAPPEPGQCPGAPA